MTRSLKIFFLFVLVFALGCSSVPSGTGGDNDGDTGGDDNNSGDTGGTPATPQVAFNPVGASFGSSDLIDLEFLPGQNGEAIVIGLGGTVYYMKSDFTPLTQTVSISVDSGSEQGLLNVIADPDYATNHFVYFYHTVQGSNPDVNRVVRYTVSANVGAGTFSLGTCKPIIRFSKSESSNPGPNHNGGALVFDEGGNLVIGVGDGGGPASSDKTEAIAQNLALRLGKLHRIVPDRNASGGDCGNGSTEENFTIPTGQNISATHPSIYARGARNPFTIVLDEEDDLFFGDVGSGGGGASGTGAFEELNCVYFAGENYGWPLFEGPGTTCPNACPPTHGYRHGDSTFDDEDPEDNPTSGQSIMANVFYLGDAYGGAFDRMLIYSDFFHGWVRALTLSPSDLVVTDEHIGHLGGLVTLRKNPVDGFLYGTSLGGSDQILKMELVP